MSCVRPAYFSSDEWTAVTAQLRISPREKQLLAGVLSCQSEAAIAAELTLSRHTVHSYMTRLYRKMNVQDRSALVVCALTIYAQLRSEGCAEIPNTKRSQQPAIVHGL
jgi:DNA-binding NarL/FixJ family response regulator